MGVVQDLWLAYLRKWTAVFVREELEEFWNEALKHAESVLHIGAHYGQEAEGYEGSGVKGYFIEADPVVFEVLRESLSKFPNQHAYLALLSDEDGCETTFHRLSNQGQSSSIYELSPLGKNKYPQLKNSGNVNLSTRSLDSLSREVPALSNCAMWVLDVQGAELLVLQGGIHCLRSAKLLKVEVSEPPIYNGSSSMNEVVSWLQCKGFSRIDRPVTPFHGDAYFVRVSDR